MHNDTLTQSTRSKVPRAIDQTPAGSPDTLSLGASLDHVNALSGDMTIIQKNARRKARKMSKALRRGSVLNDTYEIRRVLGRGGMGQVFEAQDRLLNRTVAIKVSWSHIGFEPLVQEAQALAALRGRGVPSVYAIGKHQDLGYYVMERLYGRTLAAHMMQRFSDGHFSVEEALEILIGVADSLTKVHSAGLIHRDLKPANIMLAPKNRTLLVDFGLFLTEKRAGDESGICGSPRYIAPEVITENLQSGQAHLIDVYALGIIAFMLLGGVAPFDDPSVTQILAKHVHKDPPPLRIIRPDLPPRLCRMVDQMLAKQPEDRAFSAEAVAAGLRAIRDNLSKANASTDKLSTLGARGPSKPKRAVLRSVGSATRRSRPKTKLGAPPRVQASAIMRRRDKSKKKQPEQSIGRIRLRRHIIEA